jgi:hypothetical protein
MAALSVSGFGSLGDPAFHLPMPGLYADIEMALGYVAFNDEFLDAPPDVRVSVIQQWLRGLNAERNAAVVEMFRAFAAPLRGMSIVEQIERFRQHCAREGIECPADLPLLLQRY